MMLVKNRSQSAYLLNKNPQIRLWHRKLRYISNAWVVEVSKLNKRIDIMIEDDHTIKYPVSNLGMDDENEYKNLGQIFTAENKHEKSFPLMITISNTNNL